jgi:hypothetical protein
MEFCHNNNPHYFGRTEDPLLLRQDSVVTPVLSQWGLSVGKYIFTQFFDE